LAERTEKTTFLIETKTEIEASLVSALLEREKIPFRKEPLWERAYDGLFNTGITATSIQRNKFFVFEKDHERALRKIREEVLGKEKAAGKDTIPRAE